MFVSLLSLYVVNGYYWIGIYNTVVFKLARLDPVAESTIKENEWDRDSKSTRFTHQVPKYFKSRPI